MATPKKKTAAKKSTAKAVKAPASPKAAARNGTARKGKRRVAEEQVKVVAPKAEEARSNNAPEQGGDAGEREKAQRDKQTPSIFKLPRKSAPVVFTIDDVREVLKNRREDAREQAEIKEAAARKAARAMQVVEEQQQQRVLGAATLADILGFNPMASSAAKLQPASEKDVPAKYRKYYRLLAELRDHVKGGLDAHSRDSLKTSPREAAGDIADSDADTSSFDHDFALSLVANEQEALSEINAAIQRMQNGTYGVCEITGKPISPERLEAVPFTRYSLEGQAEFERQNRRRNQRSSAFVDSAEDVAAFSGDDVDE